MLHASIFEFVASEEEFDINDFIKYKEFTVKELKELQNEE